MQDNEDDSGREIFTGDEDVKLNSITQIDTAAAVPATKEEDVPESLAESEQAVEWTAVGALVTITGSYILARAYSFAPKLAVAAAGLHALWFLT
jgi:hypothetical protein